MHLPVARQAVSAPAATITQMSVDDPVETTCYRHPGEPTLVRCSNCGRPICTRCMVDSPVGIRCPECGGQRSGAQRILRPRATRGGDPILTKALIAINVVVFAVSELGVMSGNRLFIDGALVGVLVADGEWWRMVTSAFLHANIAHIAFNMWALWILGSRLEQYLGTGRFLTIYVVGILGGSAGALLLTNPRAATVGASGAVFALMGALFVLERRGIPLVGPIMPLLLVNLAFTLLVPNVSIGGHLGGLVAGALATLVLERFGRGHVAYGRLDLPVIAGMAALVAAEFALAAYAVL